MTTVRLTAAEVALGQAMFTLMADVFEERGAPLRDDYVRHLLSREDFVAVAAVRDGEPIGGITAYVLPMTRQEASELFIYDLAVHPDWQRQGVGRALLDALRREAAILGIDIMFVPADNGDGQAMEFYRAMGGEPTPVTIFTFSEES